MDKQRTIAPFECVEVKADGDVGLVEGYASVFGVRDHGRDMVLPGAFSKSLEERKQYIMYIPSHDYGVHVKDIPAVPLDVREDAKGLYTQTKFFLNTQAGKDSFTVIKEYQKAGKPIGLSYTFKPTDWTNTSEGRNLKAVDFFEYGHTALPMLDAARTLSAKADGNYMMHSEEIDHAHAHGDTIHSHPHTHSDQYGGHSYHDHTAEQMKSLGYIGELMTNRYSKSDLDEMIASGEALADGTYPIKDEEDLKLAVVGNVSSEGKKHIIKRAKDLNKYDLIPADWKSFTIVIHKTTTEDLLSEFEGKIGRSVSEANAKKIREALTSLNDIMGQEEEFDAEQQKAKDELDRKRAEMEEALKRVGVR